MPTSWRVRVEVPAELEDELAGRLWMAGSVGSWSEPAGEGRIRVHAFFALDPGAAPDLDAGLGLLGAGVGRITVEGVA
ncbi:MAG: hypothetical protein F9K18_05445, partial [Thermoanaerobaculia bacterium]